VVERKKMTEEDVNLKERKKEGTKAVDLKIPMSSTSRT
jgi:hypothetical protein